MKGLSWIIGFIMIAIVIAFIVYGGISLRVIGEGNIQKASLQSDVYTMGHALDAAGLYMETSLRYSVYQACYDTLAGSLESAEFSDEEFYDSMGVLTQTYLNRYAKSSYAFLTDYRVVLPTSTVSIAPGSGSQFTVTTVPGDMMTTTSIVKSGESVTLKASADLAEEFDMPCYPIYQAARELNPALESELHEELNRILGLNNNEDPSDDLLTAVNCPNEETCNCPDELTCSDTLAGLLEENLDSEVTFHSNGIEYPVGRELTSATVRINHIIDDTLDMDSLEATQRITIQEANPTYYPVWNGEELVFENMKLVYTSTVSSGSG